MAQSNTMNPASGQAPTSNTDAVCTMAAPTTGVRWCLYSVAWSYSGTPTGGQLVISWSDGGTGYSETYNISGAGPAQLNFGNFPKRFPINEAVTITLKAGGSGVSGTVYPVAVTGK